MQITGGNGLDLARMEPKLKLERKVRFQSSFSCNFNGKETGDKCRRNRKKKFEGSKSQKYFTKHHTRK